MMWLTAMKNIKSWVMKLFVTVSLGSLVAFTLFEMNFYLDMSRTQNNTTTETNIDKVIFVTGETANLPLVLDKLLSASVSVERQSINIVPERKERKKSAVSSFNFAKIITGITGNITASVSKTPRLSADKMSTDTTVKATEDKKPTPAEAPKTSVHKKEAGNTKPQNDGSLRNGIPRTGFLMTRHDKNTYKFTLDCSCAVNVTFDTTGKDNASYKLAVLEASGNVLTQKMIDSETLSAKTGNLYLRAGTYTVTVGRGYSWSGKPYTLTLNASQSVNTEEESNDTIRTANDIPLNEDVRASSNTRNDIDYFRFTLDRASYVCPHLEFDPVSSGREIYSLKLYELAILNTGKRPFVFRGDGKSSKAIKPFILEAGTYIISISRVDDSRAELGLHEYTLRVEAKGIM